MSQLRRTLALAGAAALAVTLVPGAASADERPGKVAGPAPVIDGPAVRTADGDRNWLSPDRESVYSPFFAGHLWTGDDADELNTAEFKIHDWECGAEDDGILSSMLTYDDLAFLNGGPGIFMYCFEGTKTYAPVFIEYPGVSIPIEEDVAPGDRVVMTVVRDAAAGTTTYTMENTTQGWSASFDGSFGAFVNGSVETGDAAILLDSVEVPPPAFGRDAVKHVQFDAVDLSEAGTQKSQMVDDDGTTIIERATKHRAILDDQRFTLINNT